MIYQLFANDKLVASFDEEEISDVIDLLCEVEGMAEPEYSNLMDDVPKALENLDSYVLLMDKTLTMWRFSPLDQDMDMIRYAIEEVYDAANTLLAQRLILLRGQSRVYLDHMGALFRGRDFIQVTDETKLEINKSLDILGKVAIP